MYIIPPAQSTVTMFGSDGSVRVYRSKNEAVRILGYRWISYNVGFSFSSSVDDGRAFVMRDDFGDALTAQDFYHLRVQASIWYPSRYQHWNGTGAVPGTAKGKAGRHHFRSMSCGNARRTAVTVREDGEVTPRAKRGYKCVPDSRDDYRVGAREIRNWKGFRKTQWKID